MKQVRPVRIGGPGTSLPFRVESFLSWILCCSCLSVSGYHYLMNTYMIPWRNRFRHMSWIQYLWSIFFGNSNKNSCDILPFHRCFIPLTTYSRAEINRYSPIERFHQLIHVLETLTQQKFQNSIPLSDEDILQLFRDHILLRRLASLAMRPYHDHDRMKNKTNNFLFSSLFQSQQRSMRNLLLDYPNYHPLLTKIASLWPLFLKLPPRILSLPSTKMTQDDTFDISLIIPAFRESGALIYKRLERAFHVCKEPHLVQVILVDAGGGTEELDALMHALQRRHNSQIDTNGKKSENHWGHISRHVYRDGGGRGPCLNFGATVARGRILTFCHSDTTLPSAWDVKIKKSLLGDLSTEDIQTNACAFSFGIDTSLDGLNGDYYPPGIRAVETTANLRTQLFSLPYGDQVLSLTRVVFDYLGGFPDQCLMEDYELVALLRKRASLLQILGISEKEQLRIIGGDPALCSPRRWQKFGVLYVTYMNSRLVNYYAGGMDPDELYRRYYNTDAGLFRSSHLSPWELQMKLLLKEDQNVTT